MAQKPSGAPSAQTQPSCPEMDPKNNLPAVMVNQQQLKQGSCLQEASCPGSGHPHPDLIPLFKVLE